MTRFHDPAPENLRAAAIVAEVYLRIDAAKLYGLITGGPEINVDRCQEIIDRARLAGHVWGESELTATIPFVLGAHT